MRIFGLDSEYGRLTGILLHQPGREIANHPDPPSVQQLRPIAADVMQREFTALLAGFTRLGIRVELIDPAPITPDHAYLYNLMFCRDLFFMTPQGAVIASMANETRRNEPVYAAKALESLGIPIIATIEGDGRFEGADALWINKGLVAVGVGNRTNGAAFEQLKALLAESGVACVALPNSQSRTQHLLGTVQLVDHDLVLVRSELAAPQLLHFLEQQGFTVVPVPESPEVTERQAMNIVTIAPRQIVMTAGCPQTRQLYLGAGLTIAAELEISQLINAAGGLACTVGIISREVSFDLNRR